jgi:hypothetical protein
MNEKRSRKVLVVACILCLAGLALMAWSILAPTPLSVMVAMSLGQLVGTASFGLYIWVVISDLRDARVLRRQASIPPPIGSQPPPATSEERSDA